MTEEYRKGMKDAGTVNVKPGLHIVGRIVRPGFHYTTNATTTTQKQSDYKVEQSSFTLIAMF